MRKYPNVSILFNGCDIICIRRKIERLSDETEDLDQKKMYSEACAFCDHCMSFKKRSLELKTFKDPKYSDAINCIFDIFFDEKGDYKWNDKEW